MLLAQGSEMWGGCRIGALCGHGAEVPLFAGGEGRVGVMCHLCQPFWSTVQCGTKRKAACPQLCLARRMLCTAQSKPTSSPSRGEMSHCERRNGGESGKT